MTTPQHIRVLLALLFGLMLPGQAVLSNTAGQECLISGLVSDPQGGSLPGVEVTIENVNRLEITDEKGKFCFRSLPRGEAFELRFSAPAFADQRILSVSPGSVEGRNLLITLALETTRQSVVVMATSTENRLDDVPVRTELISSQAIQMSTARTLADAVEFTTGLRVESNCQNCNFAQIRMLGLEGAYTQILINGQPTVSSLASVYGVEQLPTSMIERIEVVKGGASALYGAGAVGGVINVITRIPTHSGGFFESSIDSMAGQAATNLNAGLDWVSRDQNTFLTGFYQFSQVEPVDLDKDGFTEVAKRDLNTFGLRFGRQLLANTASLSVDFTFIDEFRRGGNKIDLPPDRADLAEEIDTRRLAGGLVWRHGVSSSFDYAVAASLARTSRSTYYGAHQDPNAFGTSENPLWVFDSQFNHYLDGMILSWGSQLTLDSVRDAQPRRERLIDESYSDLGFFVQHDWFLAPGLELLSGIRLDKHSEIESWIASPRLALLWEPLETLGIRWSLSKGFRPPQAFDEDLHISLAGGDAQIIRPADNLTQENSTNIMLGLAWNPVLGRANGLFEVNGFHTRIEDLHNIEERDDPRTPDKEFVRVNFGGARVYGVEVNLGYGVGGVWQLQGGFVEQRSRFDDAEPDFGSRDFFRTPGRYGTASFTWTARPVDIFIGARYTGPMVVPHYSGFILEDRLERSPSFFTLDASVSRSFPLIGDHNMVLTLGAKNLTNAFQENLDQTADRDSDFVFGPRFPRTVFLRARVEF